MFSFCAALWGCASRAPANTASQTGTREWLATITTKVQRPCVGNPAALHCQVGPPQLPRTPPFTQPVLAVHVCCSRTQGHPGGTTGPDHSERPLCRPPQVSSYFVFCVLSGRQWLGGVGALTPPPGTVTCSKQNVPPQLGRGSRVSPHKMPWDKWHHHSHL